MCVCAPLRKPAFIFRFFFSLYLFQLARKEGEDGNSNHHHHHSPPQLNNRNRHQLPIPTLSPQKKSNKIPSSKPLALLSTTTKTTKSYKRADETEIQDPIHPNNIPRHIYPPYVSNDVSLYYVWYFFFFYGNDGEFGDGNGCGGCEGEGDVGGRYHVCGEGEKEKE